MLLFNMNSVTNRVAFVCLSPLVCSAILSPAVRVHDFAITDIQNFAVRIAWDMDTPQRSEMEVFKTNHESPFCRMITLNRREPLTLQLFYADQHLRSDPFIGTFDSIEIYDERKLWRN